jgi:phage terminase small subunit
VSPKQADRRQEALMQAAELTSAMLTPKQERFVAEYLANGLNATKAAIDAGYSERTAESQGSRLLRNVKVAALIGGKTKIRMEKLEITADRVLQELAKLAFFDPRKFFNSDGSAKQVTDLDDDTAMALAGMEVFELFEGAGEQKHAYGLSKKFRLADKGQNLERLGKHLKLFTDKTEHTGKNGAPIEFIMTRIGISRRQDAA